MDNKLSFEKLREANLTRCEGVFHPLEDWSLTDWATACAGEMGEACNVVKKLRRLDAHEPTTSKKGRPVSGSLGGDLAEEIADTVIYLDLLAARAGIDLGQAVRDKYNKVSERVGSSIRL